MNRAKCMHPLFVAALLTLVNSSCVRVSLAIEIFCDPALVKKTIKQQRQARAVMANMPDQIERWIFGQVQPKKALQDLTAKLRTRLTLTSSTVSLSESQRKRLYLAGLVDIQNFTRELEELKLKLEDADQDLNNQAWQLAHPLQRKFNGGLFDRFSLFDRAMQQSLASDQKSTLQERRMQLVKFQVETSIRQLIATFDSVYPLSPDNRDKLTKLLVANIPLPYRLETSRQKQLLNYYILYQCKEVPEKELRALFDEEGWQLFARGLLSGKAMKNNLQGLIDPKKADK